MKDRLSRFALRYGAWLLATVFVGASFLLMVAKHNAFHTLVYDLARFTQAIWYTLHGRFLYETIKYGTLLGNHFSPIMAIASPFLVLAGDARVLFLIQAINVAATGLILGKLFRVRQPDQPWIALLFLLAFYLNPAVHDITLSEVRRVVFGMPFLALGLYGLGTKRRGLMLSGFAIAMLAKEDISLYVAMAGVTLLIAERDWRWGLGLIALGSAWLLGVSLWVIPAIAASGGHMFIYPQLYYFSNLGDNYGEIAGTVLSAPLSLLRQMLGPQQLAATGRILLPLGMVLPFLSPAWVLIAVPATCLMFLSQDARLLELTKWYTTAIIPVLFGAIAVGWHRIPARRQRWAMGWLVLCTLVGYVLFSPAPLGGHYEPELYDVTDHDRVVQKLLDAVPPDAKVAAQVPYVSHLSLRRDIYHYPWIRIGEDAIEVFVLDRNAGAYPMTPQEIGDVIRNKVTDPAFVVAAEADGCFILSKVHEPWPSYPVDLTAEGAIHLDRVEVAIADHDGIYRTTGDSPLSLRPGDRLRVSLYWEALAAPAAERTVSVRVAGGSGALVAQHDGLPGDASKPTSWWDAGWHVRDVHYLTVAPDAAPGAGSLDVVIYDSSTVAVIPFDDGGTPREVVRIVPVDIR